MWFFRCYICSVRNALGNCSSKPCDVVLHVDRCACASSSAVGNRCSFGTISGRDGSGRDGSRGVVPCRADIPIKISGPLWVSWVALFSQRRIQIFVALLGFIVGIGHTNVELAPVPRSTRTTDTDEWAPISRNLAGWVLLPHTCICNHFLHATNPTILIVIFMTVGKSGVACGTLRTDKC